MRRLFSLLILFSAIALPAVAHAVPITYSESAIASGNLGGQSFTNALVTTTGSADTNNIVSAPNEPSVTTPSAVVTIAGLGSFNFYDPTEFVIYQYQGSLLGGVEDEVSEDLILFNSNPAFATYNLETAIGPLTGAARFNPGLNYRLSGPDDLTLDEVSDATFQATTASAATPELSSLILFSTGLLGLAGAARRKLLGR
jgi:hypothetical protein